MKSAVVTAVLSAAVLCPGFVGAEEAIVHLDEMDHLAQRTELFNKGVGVEEARYSCLTLHFKGEKGTSIHKDYFRIPRSPESKDWSLYFRCRFDGKDTGRELGLKLYFGDPKNPEVRLVTLREEGSSIEGGDEPATPTEGMPGFLYGCGEGGWGAWNSVALTVENGSATLWTTRGGRLFKECTGPLPVKPLIGWNVVATAEKIDLRFDRLMVVDGVARPYERGDLQEVLAGMKNVKHEEWNESFGSAMNLGETFAADLSKESFEAKFRAPFTVKTKDSPAVGCAFALVFGDKSEKISFGAGNLSGDAKYRVFRDGKFFEATFKTVITNGTLSVSGRRKGINAVPSIAHWDAYETEEINEVIAAEDVFRKPAEQVYDLKVESVGGSTYRVLLNGQVLKTVTTAEPVTGIRFIGDAGAEARYRFEPVAESVPSVWPLQMAEGGFKLERVRENLGTFMLECNHYLTRDAFENLPSSCLWNVPRKQWGRAKARCRIDPTAPEGQVPVITARLTHFFGNGGRSIAMCEESVDLSKADSSVVKVGDEYEVTFDFDIASIMDLTSMKDGLAHEELPYLHFEFTGPVWQKSSYYIDSTRSPDEELRSSVIVLSGALEESPVWFRVTPERPYSLYYPGETPKVNVALKSLDGRRYTLEATAAANDEGGSPTPLGTQKLTVDGTLEQVLELPVSAGLGLYKVNYRVLDEKGVVVQKYETSYGLLPENTREAGYDSPFYSWNFRGSHGTAPNFEDWAPAYDYLGVKRTLMDAKRMPESNPDVKAHGFTQAEFPYIGVRGDDEKAMNEAKSRMRALVAAFPHCKQALVFHESGGGPFPKELYGEKTELDDWALSHQSNRVAAATRTIKCWHEVDPSVKMIIGNSADSYGLIAELMRGGLDKSLVDSWGEESVGMTMPPEMSTAYTPWCVKRLAKIYGYTDHMDCPWEWKCRTERYERSFRAAAAVNLRDALIGFALGYTTIPVNCGTEIANSYADTIWCSGPFSRWPMAYPRENALAVATETLVLDRAKFVRQLETGSLTAYALEFQGKKGEWIYPLWTARGETSMKIGWKDGVKSAGYEIVTMLGRRCAKNDESVAVGDEPVYLVSKDRIDGFETKLSRTFRYEHGSIGGNRTVESFDRVQDITLDFSENCSIDPKYDANPFRPGEFAVRDVTDDEKGECIELEHLSQEACPEVMNEYVHLRLKNPVAIEKPFDTIGVWVKGNSSWGRVSFEIADAEGEMWYSSGIGGVGCYVYDWPAKLAFNYDGWNFLQAPLTAASDVKIVGPGVNEWLWTRDGSGNGRIDWPVKVTAIGVSQYGRTLDLLEMKKSAPILRLKGIAVR